MAVNKVVYGGETIVDLTADTVTAENMLSGITAHDKTGEPITGTVPTKTASDMTTSGATVTVPAGYYASAQSKSVATATQAAPSIHVYNDGKITAIATQEAGYVSAGTTSETIQLTVQAAQTIIPSTTDKVIGAYRFLTGTQTIKGDANLVPKNIASGVSIFGVNGALEAGGGEGSGGMTVAEYIQNGISGHYEDKTITEVRSYGFAGNFDMTSLDLLNVEQISNDPFAGCDNLKYLVLRRADAVVLLDYSNISHTSISKGAVLVPQALIDDYKTANSWEAYADYFHPIEDYTIDGTVTGEIDWELLEDAFSENDECPVFVYDEGMRGWVETGLTLITEPGMPWNYWVDSDYNDGSFEVDIENNRVLMTVPDGGVYCVVQYSGNLHYGSFDPIDPSIPLDFTDNDHIYIAPIELLDA